MAVDASYREEKAELWALLTSAIGTKPKQSKLLLFREMVARPEHVPDCNFPKDSSLQSQQPLHLHVRIC